MTEAGTAAEQSLRDGQIFGDYRVIRALGAGGMGEVYEAVQLTSSRRVALKVMSQRLESETDRKRFLREGRLSASVSHPNTVYIFGSEEIEGRPVIIMELAGKGTLKDRVARDGPLPVPEAVEVVLQVIDGLEAAQAAEVLHRDIKPANCFIGEDGIVKIGDFGLSISTMARAESMLTATGIVMGTPSFASPEQLRGDPLDVRSDIYSVGATLYYLLTGELPHPGRDLVQLITQVLQQTPRAPHEVRPDVPPRLSRVVLRALAKSPAGRYGDYHALRQALLPFTTRAGQPARLFVRVVASLIDELLLLPAALLPFVALDSDILLQRTPAAWATFAVTGALSVVYFGLFEGLRGTTPGKWLLGLRVRRTNGDMPGLRRAFARSAIFWLPEELPYVIAALAGAGPARADPIGLASLIALAALFVTVRRRNGYATLYDLITDTRVVEPGREVRDGYGRTFALTPVVATPAGPSVQTPAADLPVMIGPYAVERVIRDMEHERHLIARDSVLGRQALIVAYRADAPALTDERRELSRWCRVRWLDGERAEHSWDAYELPDGEAFQTWMVQPESRPGLPVVMRWLRDLCRELTVCTELDDPVPVGVDRLWITRTGRILLLDVPAPGAAPADPVGLACDMTSRQTQQFLDEVAAGARGSVEPRSAAAGRGTGVAPPAPVPLHVVALFDGLREQRFADVGELACALDEQMALPTAVTPVQRLLSISMVLVVFASMALVGITESRRVVRDIARSGHESPAALVNAIADLPQRHADRRLVLEDYLVTRHAAVVTDSVFWSNPALTARARRQRPRIEAQLALPLGADRGDLEQRARVELRWQTRVDKSMDLAGVTAVIMGAATILSSLSILALRSPPGLRLAGIAVVNRRNRRAGRLRLLARSFLGWAIFGSLVLGGAVLARVLAEYMRAAELSAGSAPIESIRTLLLDLSILALPTLLVALATAVWFTRSSARGPHDWITRTWLVPI